MSQIFDQSITIYGAARTDAGVHARGQVVNFYGDGTIPVEKIPYAAKGYLPAEITVLSAEGKAGTVWVSVMTVWVSSIGIPLITNVFGTHSCCDMHGLYASRLI